MRPPGCAARLLLMALTFAAPAMAYIGLVPPMTALMRHPGIHLNSDAPALGRVSSKRAHTLRMSGEVGTARSLMGKGISALEQRLADLGLVNDLVPSVSSPCLPCCQHLDPLSLPHPSAPSERQHPPKKTRTRSSIPCAHSTGSMQWCADAIQGPSCGFMLLWDYVHPGFMRASGQCALYSIVLCATVGHLGGGSHHRLLCEHPKIL